MAISASAREAARSFGLGRAAMMLYHRPIGAIRKSVREGGPWEQRRTKQGRMAMEQAAISIPPMMAPVADSGARAAFLSGSRFWFETLFCFASLQALVPVRITPVIHDDGTLSRAYRESILRVVPWAEFVDHDSIASRLDRDLPSQSYPALRERRHKYIHLRKLTDIHVGAQDWTLVLDSDMLFFRRPEALLSWFDRPRAVFMQDIMQSYGYSDALMAELAGGPVLPRINVGLYGLHSPSVDWDRVEYWCRKQIEREGPKYLQEQALTALILSRASAEPLPAADYVVWPSNDEGMNPTAALHHYVENSKRSYFQHGWRHILAVLDQKCAVAGAGN